MQKDFRFKIVNLAYYMLYLPKACVFSIRYICILNETSVK